MDIGELIVSRRTIHDFKSEPVPSEIVEEAVRLSLWAPNHRLSFPWKYYWPRGESRQFLAELAVRLKTETPGDPQSQTMLARTRDRFIKPPELLVLGMVKTEDEFRSRENYATLACSVQNLSLFLWDKGIGCKWSTGKPTRHPETYELLGVDPEQVELVGFLWMGYPQIIPKAMKRPELNAVLTEISR